MSRFQPTTMASVIVPVYNRKDRLRTVLRSLLTQDCNFDYEIIVVDDGSTDGSVDDIEKLNQRIRVIKQENQGAAEARRNGAISANSDILIFHDSDDIALPNKVKIFTNALKSHPECVAAISISVNPDKKDWKPPYWVVDGQKDPIIINKPISHFFKYYYPLANAMNIAIKKDVMIIASENMRQYKAANDYHLQFKVAAFGKFVCIPEITHEYHSGEGIGSQNGSDAQEAFSLLSMCEMFKALGKPSEYSHHVQRRLERRGTYIFISLLKKRKLSLAGKLLKQILKYSKLVRIPRRLLGALRSSY